MSMADEIQKLQALRDAGSLSEREFSRAKAAVLAGGPTPPPPQGPPPLPSLSPPPLAPAALPDALEAQARQWGLLLHLSMLAGFLVPLAGLVTPIVLWQVKKNELPGVDAHGKNAVNWIISSILYAVLCIPLIFVIVGIPMLIALGVLGIVFPIMAGVKANAGEIWAYPLSIRFLK